MAGSSQQHNQGVLLDHVVSAGMLLYNIIRVYVLYFYPQIELQFTILTYIIGIFLYILWYT